MGLKAAWKALWGSQEPAPAPTVTPPQTDADAFQAAETLAQLAGQVHAHHAELAQLRLEWAETLDKFTAWANRQAARDRGRVTRAMRSMEPDEEGGDTPVSPQQTLELSGAPAGSESNGMPHRHPKADLYARIRRG